MGKGMNDTELDKLLEEEMIREAEMIEHSLLCDDQTEDVHVSEEEIERIEYKDNWKIKIKINYEFDEETELTNCRITGGREEDSIYGIMDLISMLYNKVEDKKCLIGSIRDLLDNIEKGKI